MKSCAQLDLFCEFLLCKNAKGYENSRGAILDDSGQEASTFAVDPSFRFTNLTNLHKYVKNIKVLIEIEEPEDIKISEVPAKKKTNLNLQYLSWTTIDSDIFALSREACDSFSSC